MISYPDANSMLPACFGQTHQMPENTIVALSQDQQVFFIREKCPLVIQLTSFFYHLPLRMTQLEASLILAENISTQNRMQYSRF